MIGAFVLVGGSEQCSVPEEGIVSPNPRQGLTKGNNEFQNNVDVQYSRNEFLFHDLLKELFT